MRIATWNVNSLKARMERVEGWLAQARPDVLLMQETKLADEAAPEMPFRMAGYELAHHGQGRWNGVAIASRVGIADVVTNFGLGPVGGGEDEDGAPGHEARMIAATCGGVRVVSLYAPNGRALDTRFYAAKLGWFARLHAWLEEAEDPTAPLLLGGDLNVAPTDIDVYDPAEYVGTTHTSPRERAAFQALLTGASRTATAASTRRRPLHLVGLPGRQLPQGPGHAHRPPPRDDAGPGARHRCRDRSRRSGKGKLPSDHAPLYVDLA